jgi:hypothetical protein
MAKLITVFWRDIPAQVIAKRGRDSAKVQLSMRFQEAIDRAAMRAGKGSSDQYLDDWRRETRQCDDDIQSEVERIAGELEAQFDDEYLERIVKNKGKTLDSQDLV